MNPSDCVAQRGDVPPCVGVLALQGAFREHAIALQRCGATVVEVRTAQDLEGLGGIVLPGGESTVMGKLLVEGDMLQPLRELCLSGVPVFGTCAGLILLCTDILDHPEQPGLRVLDASVRRNAFGRQKESFATELRLDPFPSACAQTPEPPMPAVFIRAPLLERTGSQVQVLARVKQYANAAVAIRQGNILATSFHPELTGDLRLHQWVVDTARTL